MAQPLSKRSDVIAGQSRPRLQECLQRCRKRAETREEETKSERRQQSESAEQRDRDQLGVVERRTDVIPDCRASAESGIHGIGQDQPLTLER